MKLFLAAALVAGASAFAPAASRSAVAPRPAIAARATPIVAYTVPEPDDMWCALALAPPSRSRMRRRQ